MNAIYPSGAIYFMWWRPDLENRLLLENFWVVYMSAVIYLAFIVINYDIILGSAAEQFEMENSSAVKNITITNTVAAILTVITYTSYNLYAAADLVSA